MQLPPLVRAPNLRATAAEEASALAAAVIPVVPVNPIVTPTSAVTPTPSVVNLIGLANKPNSGEGVYTSVSDPGKRGSEAATTPKDWTVQRPAPEKVEDPPPEPLSKILIDQIKSLWAASASAILSPQVKNPLELSQPNPNATPGVLATEVFTYSPSKITKTQKL